MAQASRHISIGKSPDFLMSRGEIEINHRAVLKVYRIDSGSPVLIDSRAPFDRSLAVVIETLKQTLLAYSWDERSSVTANVVAPALVIIVTSAYILTVIHNLESKLTQEQREMLRGEFCGNFGVNLDNNDAQKGGRL